MSFKSNWMMVGNRLVQCRYNSIISRNCSNSGLVNQWAPEKRKVNIIKKKISEVVKWYEQFTGLDEVRMMQNRVLEEQDKFVACQQRRRQTNAELSAIQSKLKDIYSELDTTSRGEERYLHLITLEHVLLKDEKRIAQEFTACESEERDTFSVLSACVKESHEKERAQAERTKYWSVIGSVIGTIIGVVGSSISNEFKMKELRELVRDAGGATEFTEVRTTAILARQEQQLSSLLLEIKNMLHEYGGRKTPSDTAVTHRIDELLHQINSQNAQGDHYMVSAIDKLNRSVEEVKSMLDGARRHDGQLIAIPADVESLIRQQKKETRAMITGVTIIAIVVPVILAYLQRL